MSIKVRPAAPKDREGILAISRRIWEGEDYVPFVLDQWLAEGGLIVAELSGEVAGFAKTTELAPGELWLEGLRVHPEHQGKGIAKTLARAQLDLALAQRPQVVRLATVEANEASLHIARELGFREVARFFYLEADVEKPARAPTPQRPSSEETWKFLSSSQALQEGRGLIGFGWRFYTLTPGLLAELGDKGALFSVGTPPKGFLILVPDPYTPADIATLAFLDGEDDALEDLLKFAHVWASEQGERIIAAMVAAPWIFKFLIQHGFQFVPELGAVLVLEYRPRMSETPQVADSGRE
ncbi:GNAT family N-acetyltransferase [Candidatus Bipolaricaulota bacterium]|nr:GNAT family N-acetyltransferase [Candidatus Bipolaricaulota bacterium]